MPGRIYYWIHHTGLYGGNTGIQRVVRALARALTTFDDVELVLVRWCAQREAIVRADQTWLTGIARFAGPLVEPSGIPGVPLHLAREDAQALDNAWLIIPEVPYFGGIGDAPGPEFAVALDYARYYGMRTAAVFYDLIPLREPGYETLAPAHAAYARALVAADLILCISSAAAADLSDWFAEQGIDTSRLIAPRVIPLAAEMVGVARVTAPAVAPSERAPLQLVAVGSIEPRKNQVALLGALNRLARRRPDLDIRLAVIGRVHPAVAGAIASETAASGGRIEICDDLTDDAMLRRVRECDATVFVSLAEGFGLPIVESLWLGKPCLCSNVGSMSEIAAGGGCLEVNPANAAAIEAALEQLATDAVLRADLTAAARRRPLTLWTDYARAILAELSLAPMISLVAVIAGSNGGAERLATEIEATSTRVRRHWWNPDSQAILPGFRTAGEAAGPPGRGNLTGLWAILPLSTVAGTAQAMCIEDEARALGLKIAALVDAGPPLHATQVQFLAACDLALFVDAVSRDAAVGLALSLGAQAAAIGERFRVASDVRSLLGALAAQRPRLSSSALAALPRRVLYWTGLTATQPYNTGIQRVTRALGRALSDARIEVIPLKWDDLNERMAPLDATETAQLAKWNGPPSTLRSKLPADLRGDWLIVPEIAVPTKPPGSNIARLARSHGMRTAAIFYDLIPLKMPGMYSAEFLSIFAKYWRFFAEIDLALPISWTVAADLRRFLSEQGLPTPAIVVCPLAGDLPGAERQRTPPRDTSPDGLRLVAVGTQEPRKNYPRLIRALREARRLLPRRGLHLTIVGRRAGYEELSAQIRELAELAGDVDIVEDASDAALLEYMNAADVTLYGSWEEGFGLPVLESLWRGLPCLCHTGSALAEITPGGGVLAVDMLDERAIAAGIARLGAEPGLLDRLRREAVVRPIRNWREYADDVSAALTRAGTTPGWPRRAVIGELAAAPNIAPGTRPLLSCVIRTYNRAAWLLQTLPHLMRAASGYPGEVEVIVADDASTDTTAAELATFAGNAGFSYFSNRVNVGAHENGACAVRAARGMYVWLLDDDDIVVDGAIASILAGLERYPDIEVAYLNYASFASTDPTELRDWRAVAVRATPSGDHGPDRRVGALRELTAINQNFFAAAATCVFRRDHALRAYQQAPAGAPGFPPGVPPSTSYALAALQDRAAFWVGAPSVLINIASAAAQPRWRDGLPVLFDVAQRAGVKRIQLDRYRDASLAASGAVQ